ncbi:MAG TPA: protein kinase [Pirellulales bacterium]|nr:protein kinase [Pirellulales bacterium]
MPLAVEQFAHDLVENGVLSADEIQAVRQGSASNRSATATQDLARELVKRGKLTPLQASAAFSGRTKQLVLGQYLVLDKIGAGGMGQVFKAAHKLMRRTVAIKVLPRAALSSPEAVERFQREVQVAARLEHPNIVMAFDADEAAGLHFLVMQYIDGKDLQSLVKDKRGLPLDAVVDYMLQAARGLSYAHQHGVIHRDVKPANLLLDHEGMVKILDLGLARLTAEAVDTGLTSAGQVLGTIDYMAPEQGTDIQQADARADIYGLGCTLFTLVAGRTMFGGNSPVDKLLAHRTQQPPTLRSVRPEVPEALDRIYLKMVAKRPEDRYQTMDEVASELARLRGTAAVVPPPLGKPEPPVATAVWVPMGAPEGLPGMERTSGSSGNAAQASTVMMKSGNTVAPKPITDHVALKVAGTVFATIVAPILVAVALKYSDAMFSGPAPAPAPVAAVNPAPTAPTSTPVASASTQPTVSPPPLPSAAKPQMATAPQAGTMPQVATAASPVARPANRPPVAQPLGPAVRLFNGFGLAGFTHVFAEFPDGNTAPPAHKPPQGKALHGKQPTGKQPGNPQSVPPAADHVFRAARGELHVTGRLKGVLITKQEYRNYRLTIEYKWGTKIWNEDEDPFRDSGVILHCQGTEPVVRDLWPVGLRCVIAEGHTGDLIPLNTMGSRFTLEVEGERRIVETRVGKRSNTFYTPGQPLMNIAGAAVRGLGCNMTAGAGPGQRPRQKYELPLGQWNKLECICQGDSVTVLFNQAKVNHVTQLNHTKGRIALQSMNAELVIRSMLLEPIGPQ